MAWKLNPHTGKPDYYEDVETTGDSRYLKLDATNDPVTGKLTVTPATEESAIVANNNVEIMAGKKIYFD